MRKRKGVSAAAWFYTQPGFHAPSPAPLIKPILFDALASVLPRLLPALALSEAVVGGACHGPAGLCTHPDGLGHGGDHERPA